MTDCLVALGANLGDSEATLDGAVQALQALAGVELVALSAWREYAAVGGPADQPPFRNGAARLRTDLPPARLLDELRAIETSFERRRDERWAARTLDLDLLLWGETVAHDARLWLPHPRMTFRPFVMEGAAEAGGDMPHPPTGRTVAELRRTLSSGEDRVAVAADSSAEARELVAAIEKIAPRLAVGAVGEDSLARPGSPRHVPKLVVDGRNAFAARVAAAPAPTLVLAASPAGERGAELAAALQCVWPDLTIMGL
ncbi:2-amino-4-hydroxy-6-hydroxymethyldihydropteridine pyrophosphokinase [Pseudobythopirellula maris]|uniref:2-amino-4-hydroxy-6-hydroxymethyldihydropteridine pyrophosphokinase n=1 Tax=Pseudobythopirellula maris TaxID=2527991 RepID=A0A5C5ZV74_9BACT|nr:2-amino-4-hydroxy-6-hydroxymethyldihydropteridine diphosphokinase [Pseudobythopirellula maris]TWT91140.1 2-amino-4-hydroxy-6-hydroxymethyldihydropteridine pyrophosphokinase [Pseudobythopirellula maris]